MKMDETEYTELYMELEKYEKRGIDMLLDGYQASPLQIVTAHMVKEAGTYMRDYTMSGDGNIETRMKALPVDRLLFLPQSIHRH